jgi:KDO2-lipid IV(A) lauroyltransferase
METRQIANSAAALRLGHWLGRHMPLRVGYLLADGLTGVLAQRDQSALMRTLHSNLSAVLGTDAGDARVHAVAREVLRHAGHVYIDLYRALAVGPEAFIASVKAGTLVDPLLDRIREEGRGAVIVTAHMSNFDLAGLAFAYRGVHLTALGFATPSSGYDLQNQVRLEGGIDVLPIGVASLRKALEVLRQGGIVVTGVDRPDPFGGGELMPFFGRPARMPVGPVRLAMQTNSPIVVASCEHRETDRSYVVHVSRWLEVEQAGSRQESILHNSRRVLEVVEGLIAAHPEQWLMFYPVWDETLAGVERSS